MFKVYKTPCNQCLFTKNRIVSKDRKDQILRGCIEDQTHFICHKATIEGQKDVCCNLFYKGMGELISKIQIFKRMGMVSFIERKQKSNSKGEIKC